MKIGIWRIARIVVNCRLSFFFPKLCGFSFRSLRLKQGLRELEAPFLFPRRGKDSVALIEFFKRWYKF
jgi:hypothetical protein